jgi:hypoxanthine-DNA glycosylase
MARRVRSFEPIETRAAEILILGSMPGRASLAAGEYYAHPRNAFWRIASELLRLDPASSYAARVRALRTARIAVWDVLRSCAREGSLDARIENDTLVTNDFRRFFRAHTKIRHVFFNGAMAEACFRRHVLPGLDRDRLTYRRLPSTSPANASLSFARKLRAWRVILAPAARARKRCSPAAAQARRPAWRATPSVSSGQSKAESWQTPPMQAELVPTTRGARGRGVRTRLGPRARA